MIRELKTANNLLEFNEASIEDFDDDEKFVKVPIEKENENNEPIREFKTYKIVKRLTYGDTEEDNITSATYLDDFTPEELALQDHEELERIKPSLTELRNKYPESPYFKFINER